MIGRSLFVCGLILFGALALGAKCVVYTWPSDDLKALYADAHWNETPLADGEYAFTPDYPVHERPLGSCYEARGEKSLVDRGGFVCTSYVLVVDSPSGRMTIRDVATLLGTFGPIDSEIEAASFAKATFEGPTSYDGATATVNGNFLVRMRSLLDNCSETAGFYAVAYEITPSGESHVIAEEVRRGVGGGARLCID